MLFLFCTTWKGFGDSFSLLIYKVNLTIQIGLTLCLLGGSLVSPTQSSRPAAPQWVLKLTADDTCRVVVFKETLCIPPPLLLPRINGAVCPTSTQLWQMLKSICCFNIFYLVFFIETRLGSTVAKFTELGLLSEKVAWSNPGRGAFMDEWKTFLSKAKHH